SPKPVQLSMHRNGPGGRLQSAKCGKSSTLMPIDVPSGALKRTSLLRASRKQSASLLMSFHDRGSRLPSSGTALCPCENRPSAVMIGTSARSSSANTTAYSSDLPPANGQQKPG